MASDGSWQRSQNDPTTSTVGQGDERPAARTAQQPDPLEELARIMDQTNPRQPGSQALAQDDDSDNGTAPGFDQGFDDFNALLADEGLASADSDLQDQLIQPELSAEQLLADLDFGDLDDKVEAQAAPASASAAAVAPPLISDYLSPRATPAPTGDARLDDNDLLAAMDSLELEETRPEEPPLSANDLSTSAPPPVEPIAQPSDVPVAAAATPDELATETRSNQDMGYGDLSDDYFADLDRDVPPLPPVSDAIAAEAVAQEKSGGSGRMIVLGLAGLAVFGVGGVLAFGLLGPNSSNDGAPQVIAAAEGDDKVEPVANEDTASQPGDAVFETLNDTATANADTPRVVLPGPGSDSSVRSITPTADIAPAPPGSTASRPVRTVTVRADGTVVEAAAAPQVPAIETDVTIEAAEARPVQTIEVVTDILDPGTVSDDPISNSTGLAITTTQPELQSSTQAVVDQIVVPSITPPQPVARPAIAPLQPAPAQAAPVQPVQAQPAQVATAPAQTPTPQPVQLAAPTAAPATVTPTPVAPAPQQVATAPATTPAVTQPAPTGDFVVQLASLRSPEQAQETFNNLQARFGSILTGFTPNIQRADLGDRGIYHRLRVGPMDRDAANSLCQRYQAAGGDCFVQRR